MPNLTNAPGYENFHKVRKQLQILTSLLPRSELIATIDSQGPYYEYILRWDVHLHGQRMGAIYHLHEYDLDEKWEQRRIAEHIFQSWIRQLSPLVLEANHA